jgi:hypothetical protein
VSSAREVAPLCEYEPACDWLTGLEDISGHVPSNVRVAHDEHCATVFVQVLALFGAEVLITLERLVCARR